MTRKRNKEKIISILLALLLCFAIAGCGGTENAGGKANSKAGGKAGSKASSKTSSKEDFKPAKFKSADFKEDNAEGNEEVQVDLSSVSKGYVALEADSDARLKLQVFKDDETYTYDIEQNTEQIFPLQCGNGDYEIKVMKNVEGSKYMELYACNADVQIKNKFDPYLRPNQYADYSKSSECVKKSKELASKASSEQEFVKSVYDLICKKVKYDYDKAKTVKSGYIPDPDETYGSGKGICIDYACLAASMLRSQGIPTKIIFGYVEPDDLYHAWNMFYTEESGWTSVEFEVNEKKWNRIDLTFSANGEDGDFIGDGSNYTDAYQY